LLNLFQNLGNSLSLKAKQLKGSSCQADRSIRRACITISDSLFLPYLIFAKEKTLSDLESASLISVSSQAQLCKTDLVWHILGYIALMCSVKTFLYGIAHICLIALYALAFQRSGGDNSYACFS